MKVNQPTAFLTLAFVLALMIPETAKAQDWPQWRGPNRDGVVASFTEPATWPESLNQVWKVEVGTGYSTPIIVGDRIYMYTRQGEDEVLRSLDAATGEVVWQTEYPAPFRMNPSARNHGPGPKATPTFADGKLYTLGMSGIVSAFDAAGGEQLWHTEASAPGPLYGTAMSPLVDGGLVIVHVGNHDEGALTAFDRTTGEVEWSWDGDGPGYGSPIVVDLGGMRQVITFTQENLVGVSATSGDLLWRRPYTTRATQNTITPLVYRETLVVSGLGNGVEAFRVARQDDRWVTEDIWKNREVSLYMTNGVITDDALFGLSNRNSGQYFAIDAGSGETLWTSEGRQGTNAAIVKAGDLLLLLEDDAELIVARPSRTGLETIQKYTVADSATWAEPVVSGNRLFVKDVRTLTLWTVN